MPCTNGTPETLLVLNGPVKAASVAPLQWVPVSSWGNTSSFYLTQLAQKLIQQSWEHCQTLAEMSLPEPVPKCTK